MGRGCRRAGQTIPQRQRAGNDDREAKLEGIAILPAGGAGCALAQPLAEELEEMDKVLGKVDRRRAGGPQRDQAGQPAAPAATTMSAVKRWRSTKRLYSSSSAVAKTASPAWMRQSHRMLRTATAAPTIERLSA